MPDKNPFMATKVVTQAASPGKPKKLLEQVRDLLRLKHYSLRTERCYCDWIERFIRFHGKRHPRDLGAAPATSSRGPWKLIYYEAYVEQADALGREKYLKSGSGRTFLQKQLRHYLAKHPLRRTA
jgi:predicted GIY-YIG superfamily endonuclease